MRPGEMAGNAAVSAGPLAWVKPSATNAWNPFPDAETSPLEGATRFSTMHLAVRDRLK